MSQFCPICQKSKSEDELFCPDCSKKIQCDFEIDLFGPDNSEYGIDRSSMIREHVETGNRENSDKTPTADTFSPKRNNDVVEGKKSSRKIRSVLVWIVSFILLSGASFVIYTYFVKELNVDRSEWENAQRQNTVSAYVSYMNQFPKGKHFAEALSKMQQLKEEEANAWDNLRKSDNESEFHAFLKSFPKSPYKSLVLNRLDSLRWRSTLNANTVQSYFDYMVSSDSGELPGIFYNDAQKRHEMLFQSYPVDSAEYNSIRMTMDAFFVALSNVNYNKMQEILAPTIFRFFDSGTISREKLTGELIAAGSKTSKPTIKFVPDIEALQYQKTFNGHYKINIPLTKTYIDDKGNSVTRYGYIIHAELDEMFRIIGIFETKPYIDAP
jgi:outer membrane protein assembly factor BamD (BamD/ComL family)